MNVCRFDIVLDFVVDVINISEEMGSILVPANISLPNYKLCLQQSRQSFGENGRKAGVPLFRKRILMLFDGGN